MNLHPDVQNNDLLVYRKMIDQSANDGKIAQQFYNLAKEIQVDDEPVYVGFKAMSEMLMCKHVVNPFSKISHFNRGRKLLDNAISRSVKNPELLFFRFATQSNAPSLLNYNSNLQSDKLTLISFLKVNGPDKDLHTRIKTYMLSNKYCNSQEKELIKTL
jgi:hypothetical protein